MKRNWLRFISVLMLLALLVSACGSFQVSGEGGLDLGLGGSEEGSGSRGQFSNQTLLILFVAVVAVVLVVVVARGR